MKRIFTFLLALCITASAIAQITLPSNFTALSPNKYRAQLINLSNTLPNAVLDTATDATALYLTVAKKNASNLGVIYPLYDADASLSILATGVKISGTLAGTVSLEQSFDGTNWAPVTLSWEVPRTSVVGATTTTYTSKDVLPLSDVSTVQSIAWNIPYISAAYYRVKVGGTGTQTSSWKAYLQLNRKPNK